MMDKKMGTTLVIPTLMIMWLQLYGCAHRYWLLAPNASALTKIESIHTMKVMFNTTIICPLASYVSSNFKLHWLRSRGCFQLLLLEMSI